MTSLLQVVLQCNAMNISEEGRILMKIKKMEWIDTNSSLSRWNASDESPCSWNGVFCDTQFKLVTKLNLSNANISGNLSSTICGLQYLKELILPGNFFGGPFPYGLLACKRLQTLDLSENQFVGSLPHRIHELAELRHLHLEHNNFTGDIPPGFGMLPKLETLSLGNNPLNGTFPAFLSNLTHLHELWLGKCGLEGEIPSSLGNLTELNSLDLAANRLSGSIPTSLMKLSKVTHLALWENQLSGQIPRNIDELRSIRALLFSSNHNSLSGGIPNGIMSLTRLNHLNLASNQLTGKISPSLGSMSTLNFLDLSNNLLTGEIPPELGHLRLEVFNVSGNQLSGSIPAIFKNLDYKDSFLGNPNLCEDTVFWFRVKSCSSKKRNSLSHHYLPIILVPILVLAMAINLFWYFICVGCSNINNGILRNLFVGKPSSSTSWEVTPFHSGLEVNGSYILKQLTEGTVIGSGGTGKVYKANLRNGQEVAVKKISNRGNEFEAEVETLGVIRHANILKLLCCISSAESDFKLLVFEYIEKGSLFECLHGGRSESMQALGWPVRHKIAVGVARGLCYLHHDCRPPILHRDVKSSNILLDSEFEAKIADFGVSKKLIYRHQPGLGQDGLTISGFTGSHGYIAPESAYGRMKVSEKSDVYSFGVVLLELVSGKRATGEREYGESLDIVGWILSKLSRREEEAEERELVLLEVLDRRIIEGEEESISSGYREQMLRMLAVGLHCINREPSRRPSMKQVLDMLQSVGRRRNAEDDVGQWEEAVNGGSG